MPEEEFKTAEPVRAHIAPVEELPAGKPLPRQRHYLATFFLSFMWGILGVDRMYMGYWGLGILKLLTVGGFGIWAFIDFIFVSTGFMKDRQGREMLQVAEYKKFTSRLVTIFVIVLGTIVLVNGAVLIWALSNIVTQLQAGGGLDELLNSVNQFQGGSLDPSQLRNLY